jgi:uncharacterized protein YjbI with pentapeptide repeats
MNADELIRRYQAGERDFSGVDLQGAALSSKTFNGINLNHAKWITPI